MRKGEYNKKISNLYILKSNKEMPTLVPEIFSMLGFYKEVKSLNGVIQPYLTSYIPYD